MEFKNLPYLVVGAGFYGSVIAERISRLMGKQVMVIDSRSHIGGNSYTCIDSITGIEVHKYGSHIFHTSDQKVWDYITQFTKFNEYKHYVQTEYRGKKYFMPINLKTINKFYNLKLSSHEVEEFLKSEISKESHLKLESLEGKAISLIGRPLYEAFVKGYTIKQWQTDPLLLPESIITRLPVRHNENIRYFQDTYEGIPINGYTPIFEKMLNHPLIELNLGIDYFDIRNQVDPKTTIIYSGPIDRFYNYQFGDLGWRTLDFVEEVKNVHSHQGMTVLNYAEIENPYTRSHEFKFYHPERMSLPQYAQNKTILFHEKSRTASRSDLPYYPINTESDREIYNKYFEMAKKEKNVIFGGRLGSYRYFDMHHVIAQALHTFNTKILEPLRTQG